MSTDEVQNDDGTVATMEATEPASKMAKDKKSRKEKSKPLAKVVVRCLPPTMTEDEFRKQIDPIPDHDYFYFVSADWSLGVNATCRAYINFSNTSDIFIFRDKFDGYVFVDGRGNEYPAIVEFAPFQCLQKAKARKKDLKANSIESEPHYLAFLETLQVDESDPKAELKMEYSFRIKDDQKITSTPLLEYLANVRQERRDERKRKVEDRKRRREEEKQRKKTQMGKSMPKLAEEDAKDDDGIVVRTIKSRPLDRDRSKKDRSADSSARLDRGDRTKEGKDGDNAADKLSRIEREKQRNKERQARRKEERERKEDRDRKDKWRHDADKEAKRRDGTDEADDKGHGKKGSENRKQRRERQREKQQKAADYVENSAEASSRKSTASTPKGERTGGGSAAAAATDQGHKSADDSRQSHKERSVTNLRNKDRPSLQIYQPGKRRSGPDTEHNRSGDKSPSSSEVEGGAKDGKYAANRNSKDDAGKSEYRRKRSDTKEEKARAADGEKKSSERGNERRISRYSEKRNKAKEKRDTNAVDEGAGGSTTATADNHEHGDD